MNANDYLFLVFVFGVLLPVGAALLGWVGERAAMTQYDPFRRSHSRIDSRSLADEMSSAEFLRSLLPQYRNLQPSYSNPRRRTSR